MDFSLIETLRWEPDSGFVRLERHLARLARSAAALGLPGAEGARKALLAALPYPTSSFGSRSIGSGVSPVHPSPSPRGGEGAGRRTRGMPQAERAGITVSPPSSDPSGHLLPVGEKGRAATQSILVGEMPGRAEGGEPYASPPLRVRLELSHDGRIDVQTAPFTPLAPDVTWRLKVAATRLTSADPLLRHKTSRRAAYTAARAEFPVSDTDEVILTNEYGELCEGTITSLFVDDGSGILKTPPLACGLLAGVLREELLESGQAIEQILHPKDLAGAVILVGNSLRGLIPSRLA